MSRTCRKKVSQFEKATGEHFGLIEQNFLQGERTYIGRIPYGYQKNEKDVVVCRKTANVVRKIFQWKMEGMSRNQIAQNLNEMAVMSPSAFLMRQNQAYQKKPPPWKERTITSLLKNNVYSGARGIPALITKEQFQSVQEILKTETRQWKQIHQQSKKWEKTNIQFRTLIYCGYCGRRLIYLREKCDKQSTGFRSYYRCPGFRDTPCVLKRRYREDMLWNTEKAFLKAFGVKPDQMDMDNIHYFFCRLQVYQDKRIVLWTKFRGFIGGKDLMEKDFFEEMKDVDIQTVKKEELKDICQISIDENLTAEEKKKEFLRQIGNPYCFRCGDLIVKVEYAKDGPTIEECLRESLDTIV